MPKSMPSDVTALKNQLSQPGAWVMLITLELPNSGSVLRFCNNSENVVYDGDTYTAFSFYVNEFSCNTDGEIPEFTITISNIGYVLQDYMRTYDGLIESVIKFLYVNTSEIAEDFDDDMIGMTVVGCEILWPHVQLTLGIPSKLRRRVPEDRLNPHSCRHAFRTSRCGYVGAAIDDISFPSGTEVSIDMVAAHGFSTGDQIELETTGITGLDGVYTITNVDADTFTLDDTDGDDYTGSYESGGLAGYAYCQRIPADCSERGRFPASYGGPLSLRREAIRFA